MHSAPSFFCTGDEQNTLAQLVTLVSRNRFQGAVRQLHTLFDVYASTSPAPLPAPGLIITPEIRTQCERYLPLADISAVFNRLYTAALTYPPILSSTPFHSAMSWADAFASLPAQFQTSANPARLLELVLGDSELLTRFLFASFLPDRFYGSIGRYPGQREIIRDWLTPRKSCVLRCLDAACGTGEDTYALANLLSEHQFSLDTVIIEGWTIEPLEVWAATHRRFPHDQHRESLQREATATLIEQRARISVRFHCADLTQTHLAPPLPQMNIGAGVLFNLILCNGLLGGPIIHENRPLEQTVSNLVQLLAPGGLLLAADKFHGGWKQKCPQSRLRALFEEKGLIYFEAGEGSGGLKPDQ